jgi:hypothetical protein
VDVKNVEYVLTALAHVMYAKETCASVPRGVIPAEPPIIKNVAGGENVISVEKNPCLAVISAITKPIMWNLATNAMNQHVRTVE